MSLLVVGMHRSGTSTVGRVLDRLGVPTGAPNRLIGATESNALGHWEVLSLALLNNSLLDARGGSWFAPPEPDAAALAALAEGPFGEEARKLLDAELPDGVWFWKDPRLSLLLPFWRSLIADPAIVFVYRHPVEVASSLETRDEMHVAYGTALWERYVCQAIRDSEGLDSVVVDYDSLVEAPEPTIERLAAFVGQHGLPIDPGAVAEAAAAVAADERHHRGDGGYSLPPSQQQLFDLLTDSGGVLPAPDRLPDETPGLDLAFAARAEEGRQRQIEVASVQAELEAARKAVADGRREAEIESQRVAERQRRSLEELRRENGDLRLANEQLRRANDELRQVNDEVRDQAMHAGAALDAVHATKTFRLVAPLRRVYGRLRALRR